MYEFKLPDLGEGIHEAEILKWHVQEGQDVREDEPLVDVETDKASVTIPSPKGGKVVKLAGKVGDTLMVGQVLAVIDDGSRDEREAPATAQAPGHPPVGSPVAPTSTAGIAGGTVPSSDARLPVPAAPATRRLARELGVDLQRVAASGPGGRVTPEDVRRAARPPEAGTPAPAAAVPPVPSSEGPPPMVAGIPLLVVEPLPDFAAEGPIEREPLRSLRRKVARKMTTSSILVPHVAHMDEADVTELEAFRKQQRDRHQDGPPLTLLSFVAKAVVAGLKSAPSFNASLDPFKEEIIYKRYFNLGIATDTGRGLIVPVVRDAGCKSIRQLARDIDDLARRARDDKLTVGDLRGGTFTITNVGPLGGTALIPIINYPEVAILGMGRVQEKPVVREGQIVVRKMLPLTLAFDHRVADGADAARFVTELVRQLSDPHLLLLES